MSIIFYGMISLLVAFLLTVASLQIAKAQVINIRSGTKAYSVSWSDYNE